MPKYVIERDLAGAGKLSPDQLRGVSQKSCSVLNKLGPEIQWIHSYVTADKIYCIYRAPNEDMIREHAKQGGFPANKISEVDDHRAHDGGVSSERCEAESGASNALPPTAKCGNRPPAHRAVKLLPGSCLASSSLHSHG